MCQAGLCFAGEKIGHRTQARERLPIVRGPGVAPHDLLSRIRARFGPTIFQKSQKLHFSWVLSSVAHAFGSAQLMKMRVRCGPRELWARFAHQSTSGYLAAKSPLKYLVLVDQSGASVHNATGKSRSEVKTSRSFRFAAGLPIVATRRSVLPNLHRFLNPR